jgi:DNA-binding Xre family transcriptional regulator
MTKEKKPEDSKKLDQGKKSKTLDKILDDKELSEQELGNVAGGITRQAVHQLRKK